MIMAYIHGSYGNLRVDSQRFFDVIELLIELDVKKSALIG